MHISKDWPLTAMKLVLAFAFCHQALGCDVPVAAVLALLALHPLTLSIPGLLSLHALVNAPSAERAAMILLPLTLLAALIWIARDIPTSPRSRPASVASPLRGTA